MSLAPPAAGELRGFSRRNGSKRHEQRRVAVGGRERAPDREPRLFGLRLSLV